MDNFFEKGRHQSVAPVDAEPRRDGVPKGRTYTPFYGIPLPRVKRFVSNWPLIGRM